MKYYKSKKITVKTYKQKQSFKGALIKRCSEICSKFTEEHLCQSVIFMKIKSNFIEIRLLLECSFANLVHIFRTVSHKKTLRGLLLNIVTNKRQKADIKIRCNRNYVIIHYLSYLFTSHIVLTEKRPTDIFYLKVIEAKCTVHKGNFKLKVEYTAEEKRVWRFCLNKNYYIKDNISKINVEKEKITVCKKYFFLMFLKHAQRITEAFARRCFVRRLLLKHFNWY